MAIQTLGRSPETATAERALWSLLKTESDSQMRQEIITALGGVGTRDTAQALDALAAAGLAPTALVHDIKETIYRRLVKP